MSAEPLVGRAIPPAYTLFVSGVKLSVVGVRTPQKFMLEVSDTAQFWFIYLVTCKWLLNCTTGVFRSFYCIRDIDIQDVFELFIYFRPFFIPECTETVWQLSSALPQTT